MKNTMSKLTQGLILASILTACGRGYTPPAQMAMPASGMTLSQMNFLHMHGAQETVAATTTTATQASTSTSTASTTTAPPLKTTPAQTPQTEDAPQKIDLKPVSEEIVKVQTKLRKVSESEAPMTAEDIGMSQSEISAIRSWITKLEKLFLKEDADQAATASTGNFKIKSAEQGKDVSIEMFLYSPKYSKRAKFWGIDNAHDFLMAGRSPLRRWLLKKKLEGFFAPRGFSEQVLFWVEQADLLRISGVSKDDAFMLVAHGITSVPDLAHRNPIELATMRLSMKVMAFQNGFDAPSTEEMEGWVNEAKNMDVVIY